MNFYRLIGICILFGSLDCAHRQVSEESKISEVLHVIPKSDNSPSMDLVALLKDEVKLVQFTKKLKSKGSSVISVDDENEPTYIVQHFEKKGWEIVILSKVTSIVLADVKSQALDIMAIPHENKFEIISSFQCKKDKYKSYVARLIEMDCQYKTMEAWRINFSTGQFEPALPEGVECGDEACKR